MMLACDGGHAECVKLLLKHNADMMARKSDGVTAALTSLVERLTAIEQGRDHASQKKKHARTTLKDFLKVCAGAKIEIWKRPPTIVSLPEKLVLADADPHGLQEAAEQEEAHAAAAELLGD